MNYIRASAIVYFETIGNLSEPTVKILTTID